MFVRLDGGWMSHPFPLNNFKIVSAQQIETIRSLGVDKVCWDPSLSDPEPAAGALQTTPPGAPVAALEAAPSREAEAGHVIPSRDQCLAEQRAALVECERQFNEVAAACRQATGRIASDPEQAKQAVESVTSALLNKILVEEDLCVRLLRDSAGSIASTCPSCRCCWAANSVCRQLNCRSWAMAPCCTTSAKSA